MTRDTFLILIGILVALAPFSGVPHLWLDVLLPVLGASAVAIGVSYRREQAKPEAVPDLSVETA